MNSQIVNKGWLMLVTLTFFLAFVGCAGNRAPSGQRALDLRLIKAAEQGQMTEVRALIRAGADINAQDKDGWTPYLAASTMGQFEAMKLLKNLGAKTYVDEGALAIQ